MSCGNQIPALTTFCVSVYVVWLPVNVLTLSTISNLFWLIEKYLFSKWKCLNAIIVKYPLTSMRLWNTWEIIFCIGWLCYHSDSETMWLYSQRPHQREINGGRSVKRRWPLYQWREHAILTCGWLHASCSILNLGKSLLLHHCRLSWYIRYQC